MGRTSRYASHDEVSSDLAAREWLMVPSGTVENWTPIVSFATDAHHPKASVALLSFQGGLAMLSSVQPSLHGQ